MQRPAWQTGGSCPALERTEAHKRTESGRARGHLSVWDPLQALPSSQDSCGASEKMAQVRNG